MDLDIYDIARRGTTKEMKAFIKSGIDLNKKNKYGWTPLHIAIAERKEYMVFEENGADINDVDAYGITALHIARYECNFKIEELLMSYNPDLSIEDEWRTKAMEIGIA